jgi:hypothetical protein
VIGYLRDFVGFAAFFPSNDTFRPPFFFFPLARAVSLLLMLGLGGVTDLGVDFFLLATGVSLFLRIPGGVFFVLSPLTFLLIFCLEQLSTGPQGI